MADTMGDTVARNVEDATILQHTPHDDMSVGMTGIVVIDRKPIQPGYRSLSICFVRSRVKDRMSGLSAAPSGAR
jgi:hypothetical protein